MSNTTKDVDWSALVKRQNDYKKKEVPEYRFSNGRKFERKENRGVYAAA